MHSSARFFLSQVTPSFGQLSWRQAAGAKLNARRADSIDDQTSAVRRHIEPRLSAFLRDGGRHHFLSEAHAYMLISSPTATSMILGAFQVMLFLVCLKSIFSLDEQAWIS